MSRGRPRQFDEEMAVQAAMKVFWERGYRGTTCEELTSEMGISTSSFYATFRDKEGLFQRAFDAYATNIFGQAIQMLKPYDEPLQSVRQMMQIWRNHFGSEGGSPGCLLAIALVEMDQKESEVKQKAQALVQQFKDRIEACLTQAVRNGDLRADFDPKAAAAFLVNTVLGLNAMARGGSDPSDIRNAVDMAMQLIA